MREIIFRGKHIDGYGWETGDLIHNGDDRFTMTFIGGIAVSHDTHTDEISFDGHWLAEVDPATVGQYTGLKDRNGVRIFEGDIIKTHYANTSKADFIEQVVFHNGCFCGMYERDKMKMWAPLPDGIKHLPQDKSVYMEWCEVIGNIHDNPELVEV